MKQFLKLSTDAKLVEVEKRGSSLKSQESALLKILLNQDCGKITNDSQIEDTKGTTESRVIPESIPSEREREIFEAVKRCKIGGVARQSNSQTSPELELKRGLQIQDCTKTIGDLKVQPKKKSTKKDKATAGNIPSKKDRSMFSCERYQFFLDAPFEISNRCCSVMKKAPVAEYHKRTGRVPITAQMASESRLRTQVWLKQGCNAFDAKKPISNPMAFWTEQDVLYYIWLNKLPICSVYGEVVKENEVEGQLDFEDLGIFDLGRPVLRTTGYDRTGCMLCGFGCHLEPKGEGRFERLKQTHPKMYNLLDVCKNNGYTMREAIDWINENGKMHIRY